MAAKLCTCSEIEGQPERKGGIEQLKQTATEQSGTDDRQRESSSPQPRSKRPLRACRDFTTVTPWPGPTALRPSRRGDQQQQNSPRPPAISGNNAPDFRPTPGSQAH